MKVVRLAPALALVAALGLIGACSNSPQSITDGAQSFEVEAFDGPPNNWDRVQKREQIVFVEGVISDREMLLNRDDPNRPADESFERSQLSAEQYDRFIQKADAIPAMHWQVTVGSRERGREVEKVEDVVYIRRVASEDAWKSYQATGAFPDAYEELKEGATFHFALSIDRYRTRGTRADRHAFYTLVGWRAGSTQ